MQTITERVFELAPPGGLFDETVIHNLFADSSDGARALGKGSFPTINAATMYLLGGKERAARGFAQRAIERATLELRAGDNHWILATLGEAHLLLGHAEEAFRYYKAAVKHARGKLGDLRSMRDQLRLLKQRIPVSEQIESLFQIGTVLIFSGHMIDHPDRPSPRFPASLALEKGVTADIGARLAQQNITDAYCSLACGSDILFAEEALRRKIGLHLVLPFDHEDFLRTRKSWRRTMISAGFIGWFNPGYRDIS